MSPLAAVTMEPGASELPGEDTPTKRRRARIARLARKAAPDLRHLANLVGIAANGRDSEASLEYARLLRGAADALLVAALK
jgi:hypothetical protein